MTEQQGFFVTNASRSSKCMKLESLDNIQGKYGFNSASKSKLCCCKRLKLDLAASLHISTQSLREMFYFSDEIMCLPLMVDEGNHYLYV